MAQPGMVSSASSMRSVRQFVNARFTVTRLLLDENKSRTYKNITETMEVEMLSFVKDAMAMVTLVGFTGAVLTWMDMASRLVV